MLPTCYFNNELRNIRLAQGTNAAFELLSKGHAERLVPNVLKENLDSLAIETKPSERLNASEMRVKKF